METRLSRREMWEMVIPQMGFMAILRNLRNFEQVDISQDTVKFICDKLSSEDEVARSRQFPFRFWTAYGELNGFRFTQALETALGHSMRNIPALSGKSLVLVDTSASMTGGIFERRSKMTPVQAAALFGVALTVRNPQNVHLVGFASREFQHEVRGGSSMLKETERFIGRVGEVGHGTDIHGAVSRTFRPGYHNRLFIISDMQTMGGWHGANVDQVVPRDVPVYGFNLGGYEHAMMPTGSGNRHEMGGLTDSTFKMISLLERNESSPWPWELNQ